MSATRYGRIYHSEGDYINIRFPSNDARAVFAEKLENYHEGHEHDGEAPWFEEVAASQAATEICHDIDDVTIDGYKPHEIEDYHEHYGQYQYSYRYEPPACCVAPLISIGRELVDSDLLQRHELSAIFGDMPTEDYQSLLQSVETDGFIDNVVRLYEGQILDGWHRYRAAKELNLLRKLRFKQWHKADNRDGDPKAYVYAKNIERRHYSASQRAQVAVAFNERYGLGMNQHSEGSPNDEPKTRKELAQEAGVGTSTIDRAIAVDKAGQSEAVISGEKTAGEVIKDREAEKKAKRMKKLVKSIWDARIEVSKIYISDEVSAELCELITLEELKEGFIWEYPEHMVGLDFVMSHYENARGEFRRFQELTADENLDGLEDAHHAVFAFGQEIASPVCQWIQNLLIQKHREKEEADKPNPKPKREVSDFDKAVKGAKDALDTPEPTETSHTEIMGMLDKVVATAENGKPDKVELSDVPLNEIFEHVKGRVVHLPVEDESEVRQQLATVLGKASRGLTGTQLYLLMDFALFLSKGAE